MKRLLIFALGAALLAGCGGGGGSVPGTTHGSTPQGAKVPVTFKIDVPPGSLSAHRRSAQYISPATTQLLVDVHLSGYSVPGFPVTVPLTPGSSDCTTTISTTYCQFTVNLSFNTYAALITAEDANGTPLSATQVSFTVSNGQTVFPLTLSGIPASLQVAPGALAVHGPSPSGFTLYGSAPQNLVVAALDPDGNIIVGPGAPTFTANVVSGAGWSVSSPSNSSPNLLQVSPPGTNGSGATVQVTANYSDSTCTLTGAVCTTSFTIKNDIQTLFLANYTANTVSAYVPPSTSPVTISSGVSAPTSLALDRAANLFVLNYLSANEYTVAEYTPPYSGAPAATVTLPNDEESSILLDRSANLFVIMSSAPCYVNCNGQIYEYAPPYTGTPTIISNGLDDPTIGAFDSLGNLYVVNEATESVAEYAPPYTAAPATTVSTGISPPSNLLFDAAGDLFVSHALNTPGAAVQIYAPPYNQSPATIAALGAPYSVTEALDAAGNLFVADIFNNSVQVYAPPYTGTPVIIRNAISEPSAIALDGAANLFVWNLGGGDSYVTEYAPPYSGAPVLSIPTGPANEPRMVITP
jgi:hypothetical protein